MTTSRWFGCALLACSAVLALAGCDEGGSTGDEVEAPCGAVGNWSYREPAQEICGVWREEERSIFTFTQDQLTAGSWTTTLERGDTVQWILDASTCVVTMWVSASVDSGCLVDKPAHIDLISGTCDHPFAVFEGDTCTCVGTPSGCRFVRD